jgi:hypothetical protein
MSEVKNITDSINYKEPDDLIRDAWRDVQANVKESCTRAEYKLRLITLSINYTLGCQIEDGEDEEA